MTRNQTMTYREDTNVASRKRPAFFRNASARRVSAELPARRTASSGDRI